MNLLADEGDASLRLSMTIQREIGLQHDFDGALMESFAEFLVLLTCHS